MRITATVYVNKKEVPMVMLRIPLQTALKIGVDDQPSIDQMKLAIANALEDRRGEGQADEAE